MTANIIHVDNALNNLVTGHRENLRGIAEKADSLIPELLERGRAPTGSFPPMQSLGFVELDRGGEQPPHGRSQKSGDHPHIPT